MSNLFIIIIILLIIIVILIVIGYPQFLGSWDKSFYWKLSDNCHPPAISFSQNPSEQLIWGDLHVGVADYDEFVEKRQPYRNWKYLRRWESGNTEENWKMPIDHKYLFLSLTVSQLIVTIYVLLVFSKKLHLISIESGFPFLFGYYDFPPCHIFNRNSCH